MVRKPEMSPKCQLFFDRFVNQANKRAPYPLPIGNYSLTSSVFAITRSRK